MARGRGAPHGAWAAWRQLISAFVWLVVCSGTAWAQSNAGGFIYGMGAPSRSVVAIGAETGLKIEAPVSEDGRFRMNNVPPGGYEVMLPDGSQRANVKVTLGQGTSVVFVPGDVPMLLDTVTVSGAQVAPIDVTVTEASFNIGEAQFDVMPVARNITAVALLSPGAVQGDDGFGNVPTFGGSSVSENQYYLNGFNISDLRTRLGPSTVPFEFFSEMQVKTGGYSVEFGRSTGGVVNTLSKRGTNQWTSGGSIFFEHGSWEEQKKNLRNPNPATQDDVVYSRYYGLDQTQETHINLFAGGPILKNKLFVYAMLDLRNKQDDGVRKETSYYRNFEKGRFYDSRTESDPFGAIKLDWAIAPGHNFEYTGFSDKSDRKISRFNFDRATVSPGAALGDVMVNLGGNTNIFRYTGDLLSDLSMSVLYGRLTRDSSVIPSATDCPSVTDQRSGSGVPLGCFQANSSLDTDERKAYRVDFQWDAGDFGAFGRHALRFGADREDNSSFSATAMSGDAAYTVYTVEEGNGIGTSGIAAPATGDYVVKTLFSNSGNLSEELTAYYVEDTWGINDVLTATIGLRKESFRNLNTNDKTFLDLDGGIAPRLGIAWDVGGYSRMQLYANYGRYYIPVGTQSSVRNGTGEYYVREAYEWDGTFSDDKTETPGLGAFVGQRVTSDGDVPDPRQIVSASVKPSYQDEYSLGFRSELPASWFGDRAVGGIRYTYRELGDALEDIAIDKGLNALFNDSDNANLQDCDSDGNVDNFACGYDFYFITNPGSDVVAFIPTDAETGKFDAHGSGELKPVSVSNDLMGYKKPKREYHAVELSYERVLADRWTLQGSYTWSQSFGNYEGFSNSTIEQEDVAITQDFDQPGFGDGAYGFLPNDRRHSFKLFGSYDLTHELQLGGSFLMQSGRPYSALGYYYDLSQPEAGYANYTYYTTHPDYSADGSSVLVPRGKAGRTPTIWNLDLSLRYVPAVFEKRLKLGLDLFNVFNNDAATELFEGSETTTGAVQPLFRTAVNRQSPRSLQARLEFSF